MSYEGYDKLLCASGHLRTYDAFVSPIGMFGDDDEKCSCGKRYVWWCSVDQTNGYEVDNETGVQLEPAHYPGDVELAIDVPAKVEVCNLGHEHMIEEARYKIPAENVGHHLKPDVAVGATDTLSHTALIDAACEGVALGSCDED